MAYSAPSVAELVARFPEFGKVDDSLLQLILDEAGMFVDRSWTEGDHKLAQLYLAAHILVATGALAQTTNVGGVDVEGNVTSVAVGDVRVSFGQQTKSSAATAGDDSELAATAYGQMFLTLRRRNFPAVAVVI